MLFLLHVSSPSHASGSQGNHLNRKRTCSPATRGKINAWPMRGDGICCFRCMYPLSYMVMDPKGIIWTERVHVAPPLEERLMRECQWEEVAYAVSVACIFSNERGSKQLEQSIRDRDAIFYSFCLISELPPYNNYGCQITYVSSSYFYYYVKAKTDDMLGNRYKSDIILYSFLGK